MSLTFLLMALASVLTIASISDHWFSNVTVFLCQSSVVMWIEAIWNIVSFCSISFYFELP